MFSKFEKSKFNYYIFLHILFVYIIEKNYIFIMMVQIIIITSLNVFIISFLGIIFWLGHTLNK